jgi:hypothetical protein
MRLARILTLSATVLAVQVSVPYVGAFAEAVDDCPKVKLNPSMLETPLSHDDHPNKAVESDENESDETDAPPMKPLKGCVTDFDLNEHFGRNLDFLSSVALERMPQYRKAEAAVEHYRKVAARAYRAARDAANYTVPYRGFSMSKEGATVLMDKVKKLNNLQAAEYVRQKMQDEMHPKITGAVLQIAMGLGTTDKSESQRMVEDGSESLKKLVGEEQAQKTVDLLVEWKNQLTVPESAFKKKHWDVTSFQTGFEQATKKAAATDPILLNEGKKIKKYNYSRLSSCAAGLLQAGLSIGTVATAGALPAAFSLIDTGFTMATGGPESCKILKEVYYGQDLNVRRKRISDEVTLALTNYQTALLTHNPALLACSEAVLAQLVGQKGVSNIVGADLVNEVKLDQPIQISGKVKH